MPRPELYRSQIIDLTTTGRRTGESRRIEIYLHHLDGRLFISGQPSPRTRAWVHNVTADPNVVIHLKVGAVDDVPARARVLEDPDERRPLIEAAARRWGREDVDVMMAQSPLIELTPSDAGQAA
ncbi:nitroreductase family deazaflavin-dependent oxidoreductase [Cellulomonas sp. URHE0023]|uniref:nitroreductase family deazaflavin-dependent oxidoreductase n=1 Tax=Cellulomonas sp. URHE0023 TaxID=1380354 RepID=UPI000551ADF6|nr:nitroreductase family deazaflavin-dependent oxidoreductase [Cellulomonas sp. URHE0023]